MKIRFGLHFDGQRGWQPKTTLGEFTVGPSGFLEILETHLGLLRSHASQSERIVQYRDCLRQGDDPERFFHRTFATDELGTSATLVGLAGCLVFERLEWESSRLPHLQEFVIWAMWRTLPLNMYAPSIGERLIRVVDALQNRKVPIDRGSSPRSHGGLPETLAGPSRACCRLRSSVMLKRVRLANVFLASYRLPCAWRNPESCRPSCSGAQTDR